MAPKKLSGASDQQFDEISNPNLPNGWKRVIVKRQNGKTKDIYDIYIVSPDGKKLRSSIDYLKHVSKTKTPCRMSPEECVRLFKKCYLKAENFANHELLIKLVPSLATEEEREKMGITLTIKKRGRPKKNSTNDNNADQDRLSPLVPTSKEVEQEDKPEIGFKLSKRGRPKKNYSVEEVANQDLMSESDIRCLKTDLGTSGEPRKPGRPRKNFQVGEVANQDLMSESDIRCLKTELGTSGEPRKPGRPRKNFQVEEVANQDLMSESDIRCLKTELGTSGEPRKPGRPRKNFQVEEVANQDLMSESDIRCLKTELGTSGEPRKPGRPRKNFQVEEVANQDLMSESDIRCLKTDLGTSGKPRKPGRPRKNFQDKCFVLLHQQSKLLSTLGKEPRIFKRRKRRGRTKSENLSGEHESSSKNETEENCVDHQETRADKSVQTDDFLFAFKNVSNNFQSFDCVNSQDNQQAIVNFPTKMVFTSFENDEVGVAKRFTYLPSSISNMKWDSVSGRYVIDVDGKVIPCLISNDEEHSRMEEQDSGENCLSMSPNIKDFYDSDINIEDFEESKMCDMDAPRYYFIDHTSAITICHRPKSRDSTWIPPKSPYNIIQQLLYDDPWKLLISTFFEECHDPKHFWEFVNKWPSAKELLRVNVRTLADFLKECGIHRLRAGTFLKFTDDFLHTDWVDPAKLFGIRNFARECYILFYLGEWQTFKPKSGLLKLYLNWYHENFVDK